MSRQRPKARSSSSPISGRPDSSTRSRPVMPNSAAPSATNSGMSCARTKMAWKSEPSRATSARSARNSALRPARSNRSRALSASLPLLGTAILIIRRVSLIAFASPLIDPSPGSRATGPCPVATLEPRLKKHGPSGLRTGRGAQPTAETPDFRRAQRPPPVPSGTGDDGYGARESGRFAWPGKLRAGHWTVNGSTATGQGPPIAPGTARLAVPACDRRDRRK